MPKRRFCAALQRYAPSILMLAVFETVGVALWLAKGNLFYLGNFSYIGASIALGLFLFERKARWARRVVQFLVGAYMLVFLGLYRRENMQIEGFWYYLFLGVFEAATIHYAVAKIFGPLLFGRGWCGYACWTAAILDFLPWKRPRAPRRSWGWLRYLHFALSLALVAALFASGAPNLERTMFLIFLAGNALYYAAGIALAAYLGDNRAFCKYLCPVTAFLKPASRFSLMRVRVDAAMCTDCGACARVCPMDVDVRDGSRARKNATECILCLNCVEKCPNGALKL